MSTQEKKYNTVLWIIVALLVAVLLVDVFSIVTTFRQNAIERDRAATYEERVQEAQALVDRQQEIILDLVSDYETLAYDNPNVDRISEQQLIASESQLQALQIIAVQNSQIIELLSAAP